MPEKIILVTHSMFFTAEKITFAREIIFLGEEKITWMTEIIFFDTGSIDPVSKKSFWGLDRSFDRRKELFLGFN
jgi:hypothetical protein